MIVVLWRNHKEKINRYKNETSKNFHIFNYHNWNSNVKVEKSMQIFDIQMVNNTNLLKKE